MSNFKKGAPLPCSFPVTCCKDCADRHLGCHSSCETYQSQVAEGKKKREWLKKMNEDAPGRFAYDKHIPNLIDNPSIRKRKTRK